MKPTVAILVAPGTNRHHDLAFAFSQADCDHVFIQVTDLPEESKNLSSAQIIAVAGGFSYADALGSGRVFSDELNHRIGGILHARVAAGVPVIGICNGFQMLVRSGLLTGDPESLTTQQQIALAHNDHGNFVCRWVTLAPVSRRSIWTAGLSSNITCPVAHGEGRVVASDKTLTYLHDNDMVALRYVNHDGKPAAGQGPMNPNGSIDDIAGLCDSSGLVLGLMPHPENHVTQRQSRSGSPIGIHGLALNLFKSGVQHVKQS